MKRFAISVVRSGIHIVLFPLEMVLRAFCSRNCPPPIFIIGAPRSGTSLLYELMVTRYRFAIISNLAHRFYLTPLAASRLGKSWIQAWRGNFESRYGHIAGWGAPNEGGWVWRRWLRDGDWTDGAAFPKRHMSGPRRLVSGLSSIFGAPFLNKNVMHSNRLLLMQRIWPDALYIHVRRDVTDNARSIVRAERKDGGPVPDAENWWSVRPSIAENYVGSSDVVRAVAQVIGVDADIKRDMQVIGTEYMWVIDYSDMCDDPRRVLEGVAKFLEGRGVNLQRKGEIPARFSPPPSKMLDADDDEVISKTVTALLDF